MGYEDEVCTSGSLSDTYYEFTINDSYSDGICCSYGSGSYTVKFDGVEQAAGGQFTNVETKTFGNVNCSPSGPTASPTQSPTASPTASPTTSPTTSPTPPPNTSCTSGALKVSILTDNYPAETTWTLKNGCSGEEVMSGGSYSSRNTLYEDEVCTSGSLSDTYYEFTINDSWGDGVCCGYGSGSYTVTYDDDEQAAGGDFGSVETKTFGNLNCGP